MAFENISLELQNIYLQEFSNFSKWLVLIIFLALSTIYVFHIWKNQKKTISVMIAVMRAIAYVLSVICLLTSPYLLILMSPQYSFWEFFLLPLTLYSIFFLIFAITCGVDLIKLGVPALLKFGNLDMKDPNINELMRNVEKNNHGLK